MYNDKKHSLMEAYDSKYISDLILKNKKKNRIKIIESFIYKERKNNFDKISSPYDKITLINTIKYQNYLILSGFLISGIAYMILFYGVYNAGNFYFNPKSIHWLPKVLISSSISYAIYRHTWKSYIYDPEFYRLAVSNNI